MVEMAQYTLHIPDEIERQLQRCRASLRESIRRRLDEIVKGASVRGLRSKPAPPKAPPLRFYVYEGYRISYEVNPITRRVVVTTLHPETA